MDNYRERTIIELWKIDILDVKSQRKNETYFSENIILNIGDHYTYDNIKYMNLIVFQIKWRKFFYCVIQNMKHRKIQILKIRIMYISLFYETLSRIFLVEILYFFINWHNFTKIKDLPVLKIPLAFWIKSRTFCFIIMC